MRFDQAGHQGKTRQVDHFRACRRIDAAHWSNSFDLLAANEYHPVVMYLRRLTIKDVSRLQQVDSLCGFSLLHLWKDKRKTHQEQEKAHSVTSPKSQLAGTLAGVRGLYCVRIPHLRTFVPTHG